MTGESYLRDSCREVLVRAHPAGPAGNTDFGGILRGEGTLHTSEVALLHQARREHALIHGGRGEVAHPASPSQGHLTLLLRL